MGHSVAISYQEKRTQRESRPRATTVGGFFVRRLSPDTDATAVYFPGFAGAQWFKKVPLSGRGKIVVRFAPQ